MMRSRRPGARLLAALAAFALITALAGCPAPPSKSGKKAEPPKKPEAPEKPVKKIAAPRPPSTKTWDQVYEESKDAAVDVYILTPTGKPGVFGAVVGAGVIINKAGYILTNSHVVSARGRRLIGMADGTKLPFRIIGQRAQLHQTGLRSRNGPMGTAAAARCYNSRSRWPDRAPGRRTLIH